MQSAHIVGMGRLFFYFLITALGVIGLLFFPIVVEADVHYDMNRRKFGFALYAYKTWKLAGGYVTTYPGGFALHISPDKAILKPYSGMESDRKKFSFVRTFRVLSFSLLTETGAEYLLPVSVVHAVLRAVFFSFGGDRENIRNNLWLTDGDELRISADLVLRFNLYLLLRAFMKSLKEKIKNLWQKKTKKSIV